MIHLFMESMDDIIIYNWSSWIYSNIFMRSAEVFLDMQNWCSEGNSDFCVSYLIVMLSSSYSVDESLICNQMGTFLSPLVGDHNLWRKSS